MLFPPGRATSARWFCPSCLAHSAFRRPVARRPAEAHAGRTGARRMASSVPAVRRKSLPSAPGCLCRSSGSPVRSASQGIRTVGDGSRGVVPPRPSRRGRDRRVAPTNLERAVNHPDVTGGSSARARPRIQVGGGALAGRGARREASSPSTRGECPMPTASGEPSGRLAIATASFRILGRRWGDRCLTHNVLCTRDLV